jgi:hypothetical protein
MIASLTIAILPIVTVMASAASTCSTAHRDNSWPNAADNR